MSTSPEILVGLVEDNSDDIKYFEWLLKDLRDIKITRVEMYRSGEECLERFNTNIQVLLMDYNLGRGISGVETLRRLKKKYNRVRVVILTGEDFEPPQIVEALTSGATGFLRKREDKFRLEQVIRDANEDRINTSTYVFTDLVEYLKDEHRRRSTLPNSTVRLTWQEMILLKQVASGKNNEEIAAETDLSAEKIRRQLLPELYRKLGIPTGDGEGVNARIRLIGKAFQLGLLRQDDLDA